MNALDRIIHVLLGLCLAASALAQDPQKPPDLGRDQILPPRTERVTELDEDGLKQWPEYEAPDCPLCDESGKVECQRCKGREAIGCLECERTAKAPCHACGGAGKLADPLEKALCPGCNGAGSFPCSVCSARGEYTLQGSGGRPQKCVACRGDGGFECGVCEGDRLVDVVRLRPSVAEADLDDLQLVRQKVEETLVAVRDFTGLGTVRKDLKEYEKALAPAARFSKPLKQTAEFANDLMMKELAKGNRIEGNEEESASAFQRFRQCNISYLEHQLRILDLCIARQEFNDEVLEKKEAEGR